MSHSHPVNKEDIYAALRQVHDTDKAEDVVSAGLVSSLVIKGGHVGFALQIDPAEAANKEPLRQACEAQVKKIAGVEKVTVVLTAHQTTTHISSPRAVKAGQQETRQAMRIQSPPAPITGVKHVVGVAAGKGGVGKSTVAVNLGIALAKQGLSVGIADADIYGPSIPTMLGIRQKPEIDAQNRMVPIEAHGVQSVSMGYILPEETATVWRGPMTTKALYQLLRGTAWGKGAQPLDVVIVDLPPGTGDVHLSLVENFPVDGIVIVTTPQEVALADVKKAMDMYRKVQVPILGIIENMSYFEDPQSGNRSYIFGQDGGKRLAEGCNVPFWGEIPLQTAIREGGDNGQPVALGGSVFGALAEQLVGRISHIN